MIAPALAVATADKSAQWWETVRDWLIGVPLQVLIILVVAVVVQLILNGAIRRVVNRASERAKHERLAQMRQITRTAELSDLLMNQRTEQRAAAIQLAEGDRDIGRDVSPAVSDVRAHDRERAERHVLRHDTHEELSAKLPESLGFPAERLRGNHQFSVARRTVVCNRILELLRNRPGHVFSGDELEFVEKAHGHGSAPARRRHSVARVVAAPPTTA